MAQPAIHVALAASDLSIEVCDTTHILAMEQVRPEQAEQLAVSRHVLVENPDLMDPRHSWVALVDEVPVAAWGVFAMHPGVGTSWALFTLLAQPWAIRIRRATAFHMEHRMHRELGYHRLQCTIDSRDEKALRWARLLRYKEEGLMHRYGPGGEDHILMAKVWA